jgi:phosphoglycerate dehydrogenase-like enzyme
VGRPGRVFGVQSRVESSTGHAGAEGDLQGRTVVVVGLALSGRAAAQLALARGAHVVGVDLNMDAVSLEVRCPYPRRLQGALRVCTGLRHRRGVA